MATRQRRKSAIPEFHEGQLLNWSSSRHWNYDGPQPCRYCGKDAFLLDSHQHPAHKACAETALAAQYTQALRQYQEGVL